MGRMTKGFEAAFERFARLLIRRRGWALLLIAVSMAALFSQLPKVRFDTSTEGFFRPDDPAIAEYNAFREQYGRDEMIVVAVEPPEVFSLPFLEKLRDFHHALESEVPHLDDITSLINARNTRGEGDTLVVEDLLKTLPKSSKEMARLRERVMTSSLYRNLLISEDGHYTTVVLKTDAYSEVGGTKDLLGAFDQGGAQPGRQAERPLLTDAENSAIVHAVEAVAARFQAPDFKVWVTGSPVVTDLLKRAMQRDMRRFLLLAAAAIGLFLAVLFRRVGGVVLPLLIVLLSLFATIAAMAAFGVPLKIPTTVLPSFLLAVGVGASVHLLAIYYRQLDATGDRSRSIVFALGHSGLPILMTSITTAVGLASFATARMAPIGDLGRFAALGVMISLVLTLVLLPVLLAWWPTRTRRPVRRAGQGRPFLDRLLAGIGDFATGHPWPIVIVSAAVLAVAAVGTTRLHFSHNTLAWFPEQSALRQATETIDQHLKGSIGIEVVVDTGRENGMYDPETLDKLDEVSDFATAYRGDDGQPFVGKTLSLADTVKEINQALNEERPEAYRIPDRRKLVAQELLLFENSGSDDLEDVTDSLFSQSRLTAKVSWKDAAAYVHFVDDLKAFAQKTFGEGVTTHVTGFLVLFTQAIDAMMHSTVTSYAIAFAAITVLMILLVGNVRIGLLSMVPNFAPIVFTLGLMGWVGLRLDMFTLLIGSIAIGLAVDDTIHFFHNFRRYYGERGEARYAVHETLLGTGRAMLFTSLVLVTGFWLFMFASLNNLFAFGLLTGVALIVAFLADVLLSPALLTLVTRAGAGRALARKWGGTR